jgi:hypothetical protein
MMERTIIIAKKERFDMGVYGKRKPISLVEFDRLRRKTQGLG